MKKTMKTKIMASMMSYMFLFQACTIYKGKGVRRIIGDHTSVIDDMELARASFKEDLKDYCPNVEVVGEADGVLSGAKLLKQITPDIIFSRTNSSSV